jgi:hypothetical protein
MRPAKIRLAAFFFEKKKHLDRLDTEKNGNNYRLAHIIPVAPFLPGNIGQRWFSNSG